MKHTALKILALLAIGSVTMHAQLSRGVIAKVPFDFVAGHKSFPAGEYRITSGPARAVITIRSLDGKTGAFAMTQGTESAKAHPQSSLVFNRYGNQYFLKQVLVQGEPSGVELPKTPAELEAEARGSLARTSVTASVNRR